MILSKVNQRPDADFLLEHFLKIIFKAGDNDLTLFETGRKKWDLRFCLSMHAMHRQKHRHIN
jgi:hypothetical protein